MMIENSLPPSSSAAIVGGVMSAAAVVSSSSAAASALPGAASAAAAAGAHAANNAAAAPANALASSSSAASATTNHISAAAAPNAVGVGAKRPGAAQETQVLDKKRLLELVKEVDPSEELDADVADLLLHVADDFIEQTVSAACALARHRKAAAIDVKDVQLVLERNWSMWVPGFGVDDVRPYKRSATTEAHKARMALIRKALKKY